MNRLLLILSMMLVFQGVSFSAEYIQFDFPNEGWHSVASPDGVASKKCYVPSGQSSENFNEMLIFFSKKLKNTELSAMAMLQKQLGKDKNNYMDIIPEYIVRDIDNSMITWCSKMKNTCNITRAFQGNDGIVFATYLNKAPHYSQNMFGQWSNILSKVKVYNKEQEDSQLPHNVIAL